MGKLIVVEMDSTSIKLANANNDRVITLHLLSDGSVTVVKKNSGMVISPASNNSINIS
jgi:hypothetical protein